MLSVDNIKKVFEDALRRTGSLDRAFSAAMFAAYTAGLEEDAEFVACGGATYVRQRRPENGE